MANATTRYEGRERSELLRPFRVGRGPSVPATGIPDQADKAESAHGQEDRQADRVKDCGSKGARDRCHTPDAPETDLPARGPLLRNGTGFVAHEHLAGCLDVHVPADPS